MIELEITLLKLNNKNKIIKADENNCYKKEQQSNCC